MVSEGDIYEVLRTIDDPEMPINIVDLGMIARVHIEAEDKAASLDRAASLERASTVRERSELASSSIVQIDILPTFIGCPALPMIENEIRTKVEQLKGVSDVRVRAIFDPPWSVDRISEEGRAALQHIGVTVPGLDETATAGGKTEACPFCGSSETHLESPYGPTRCRMIYYCADCKNSFEHMKKLGPGQ